MLGVVGEGWNGGVGMGMGMGWIGGVMFEKMLFYEGLRVVG